MTSLSLQIKKELKKLSQFFLVIRIYLSTWNIVGIKSFAVLFLA